MDTSSGQETDDVQQPTNLSRDKRPEIHGYGPDVSRHADGSIREIELTVGFGGYDGYRLALTYYVTDGTAHVKEIENAGRDTTTIAREHLRMLALADDVVSRVPGVVSVTRIEREIANTRDTYERELGERCDKDGCYDMPDKALGSGKCREHTPREERQ
ncbi:hypothetical protein [Halococcus thailandensis]|uniref:Uncharacterized protein n=1 Tax=Halococcus thailandensis JCM 13552 TaxID=1227457 RepID=M0MWR0_9EURY|nr:hypothetical protein [Halococcus thailandensis]EMA49274.1 hypothetical protein C451_19411 [Halococcus thailandensis JCM 13552]